MKHFKLAYSDKAYSVLNPITEREIVGLNDTDFTDVAAIVITDADTAILDEEAKIAAFGIPVFLVLVEGTSVCDEVLKKVFRVMDLREVNRGLYERQIESAAAKYESDMLPPFFKGLATYVEQGYAQFDCPGHQGGAYFAKHPAGRAFYDFFGENIFRADLCNADVALGDLLIHQGPALAAQQHAAKVYNADKTYFVLNGTSSSNKVVLNAVVAPGDIVLYDRNNHKSNAHGALVQQGGIPVYLETSRNSYGSIGGILAHCFDEDYIRKLIAERDPVKAKAERPIRLAVIQLGTYDGCIYNARQVVDKIGHLCDYIFFDSAWVGYEQFIPMMKDCSPLLLDLKPEDPGIFVTQSVHKQLAGFSQASQILKKDKHVKGQARYVNHKRLNNTFMLHESTSPIYSIFASLDVNAKMQEGKAGRYLWKQVVKAGIELRKAIIRNCHYLRPMLPATVHGKPWEDGDTEKMANDMAYWTLTPGAEWHGFEGYGEGQFLLDPCKLQLMTPGIDLKTGEYTEFGIHGAILSKYLQANNLIPEKNDLNAILFLLTPGTDMTKVADLVAKLCEFERLVDENAPMSEVLPAIYYANEDTYKGFTIRDLAQKMQDFYSARKVNRLQQRLFMKDFLPEYFMAPQDANYELVRGHCELVKLSEARGRVGLEGALPYPPGILTMQPGERWSDTCVDYFLALEEGINQLPGFTPEIQGVYFQPVEDGSVRAFAYCLDKETEERYIKTAAERKALRDADAR